ncbi:hypothetical protein E9229_001068 [Paeniglutamicibacter cryotolerans]|uniref:Uncharacterized protein n=1 Tax=Paeniglutamicibacter cryotolerans TaxID=670079 RepID=A0A839QGP5_9MICC|nr:hypothetical protein [Paeniglutamicibacter cryotolerans]
MAVPARPDVGTTETALFILTDSGSARDRRGPIACRITPTAPTPGDYCEIRRPA